MDIGPQQSLRFSDRKYTTEERDSKWYNRVWQPHFAHFNHWLVEHILTGILKATAHKGYIFRFP